MTCSYESRKYTSVTSVTRLTHADSPEDPKTRRPEDPKTQNPKAPNYGGPIARSPSKRISRVLVQRWQTTNSMGRPRLGWPLHTRTATKWSTDQTKMDPRSTPAVRRDTRVPTIYTRQHPTSTKSTQTRTTKRPKNNEYIHIPI